MNKKIINHLYECENQFSGDTDIASLIVRAANWIKDVQISSDGLIKGYFIDLRKFQLSEKLKADLDEYFKIIGSTKYWVNIYDDNTKIFDSDKTIGYRNPRNKLTKVLVNADTNQIIILGTE